MVFQNDVHIMFFFKKLMMIVKMVFLSVAPLFIAILFSCGKSDQTPEVGKNDQSSVVSAQNDSVEAAKQRQAKQIEKDKPLPPPFGRAATLDGLKTKAENGEMRYVHVFVALCDNKHQGIVPVPKHLGNGQNPKGNLYWGAMYGIRTHFSKSGKWERVPCEQPKSNAVLKRVAFRHKTQKLIVVADAYDGSKMRDCLNDFFASLAGGKKGEVNVGESVAGIYGNADLLLFNGHNGLMDFAEFPISENVDGRQRDAAVIACASKPYFNPRFLRLKAYPLLMTTNLMAPEAYVAEAVIETWASNEPPKAIHKAAANAYNKYQKCGYRGAHNLFATGF